MTAGPGDGSDLRADCSRCFGLCCVALPFSASADFAVDKAAGTPCTNLDAAFGCTIHADLRGAGFAGCAAFDCLGAGQKVSQVTYGGVDWRSAPGTAQQMFTVFPVMHRLHELLRYLTDALTLPAARPVHDRLEDARTRVAALTGRTAAELATLDVAPVRDEVNVLLRGASDLARVGTPRRDLRGRDLTGARLGDADLRGADLRGASLVAADLRGVDLDRADLTGADLRAARLDGADLSA
ncbi:pentapeptide repeat-containing protein, partial [Georgenia sp. 10Sc9-8]|nr:pentapeptide repeat-containing protein [Georgenia halotolerans]